MLVDSHCHPDGEVYDGDRAEMLRRAAAAGLSGLVAIGGGAEPGSLEVGLKFARRHQDTAGLRMWATVGVHPHEAARATPESWAELRSLAADPLVVAIGEIGLDYHYDHSPRERQREVFTTQLKIAAECNLPVSVHCREALDDCLEAIRNVAPAAGGVFHCFTGSREEAEQVLALGWYLSFAGVLTFAKAEALRAVAAWAPLDRILIETDAPFLAPTPHRGKRNEPAWVVETALRLGKLRGLTLTQIAKHTTDNFFRLFPRALEG